MVEQAALRFLIRIDQHSAAGGVDGEFENLLRPRSNRLAPIGINYRNRSDARREKLAPAQPAGAPICQASTTREPQLGIGEDRGNIDSGFALFEQADIEVAQFSARQALRRPGVDRLRYLSNCLRV